MRQASSEGVGSKRSTGQTQFVLESIESKNPRVQNRPQRSLREFVSDLIREASKDQSAITKFGFTNWLSFLNEVDIALTYGGEESESTALDNVLIVGMTDTETSAKVTNLLRQTGPQSPMAFARKSLPNSNGDLDFNVRVIPDKYQKSLTPLLRNARAWVQGLYGETVMVIPKDLAEQFIAEAQTSNAQPYRRSAVSVLGHELSHTELRMMISSGSESLFGSHFDELRADLAGNAHAYHRTASLFEAVEIITGISLIEKLQRVVRQEDVVRFYEELCSDIGPAQLLLLGVLAPGNYEATRKREYWPWESDELSPVADDEEADAELINKDAQFLQSLFMDQVEHKGVVAVLDVCREGLSRLPPAVGRIDDGDLARYFGFEMPDLVQMEFDVLRSEGLQSIGPLNRRHAELAQSNGSRNRAMTSPSSPAFSLE